MTAAATLVDTTSPFGTYRARGLARFAWRLADWHDLAPTLRKKLRAVVARLFAGPFDAEVEGIRFRLYPGSNYDDRKILARQRLPERAAGVVGPPPRGRGWAFVVVGPLGARYCGAAGRCGATVLAVEANPETAGRLAFNIAANGLAGIDLATVAVGERRGTMELWSEPSNCGFATLLPDLTEEWQGDWRPRQVRVEPLAEILVSHGVTRVDVLKVDVEGYEDRVLLPYIRSTDPSGHPGAILLETNCREHWQEDCLAVLAASGYRVEGETKDNVLLRRAA